MLSSPAIQIEAMVLYILLGYMKFALLTMTKAISAIVVAITMINEFTRTLKYKRKIVLVTNGTGPMSGDGLEEIQKKLVQDGIELVIL